MLSTIKKYCRKPLVWAYSKIIPPKVNGAGYGVVSGDPPILYVAVVGGSDQEYAICNKALTPLFSGLGKRRAYFLYKWRWYAEDSGQGEIVKRFEEVHTRKYPTHHFIHLCNTLRQQEVFREKGLTAEFINQNCLVDEKTFRPLPSVKKIYDAVYDARLKKYKRHELAGNIQNLALIYDYNPIVDIPEDMKSIKSRFRHAHYFNHGSDGTYQALSAEEVNRALNACKVGLCLSQREGAMYASIQYLLSGLPVVSTKSEGGRDVFFDDEYVEIVEDDADAVAQGVRNVLRANISPQRVREQTLKKIEKHRKRFQAVVQNIYEREGIQTNFTQEWEGVFFNKLIKWQNPKETIKSFERN